MHVCAIMHTPSNQLSFFDRFIDKLDIIFLLQHFAYYFSTQNAVANPEYTEFRTTVYSVSHCDDRPRPSYYAAMPQSRTQEP